MFAKRHFSPMKRTRLPVFLPDPYESMQFLIDRGIDMTMKDYRWDSNAVGWARYGKSDEKMAQLARGGGTAARNETMSASQSTGPSMSVSG